MRRTGSAALAFALMTGAALSLSRDQVKPSALNIGPKYTRVSVSIHGEQANARSHSPRINGDGSYVAYLSAATNLTPDHYGGAFVRDVKANRTFLASPLFPGSAWDCPSAYLDDEQRVDISDDGRYVVFDSNCPNMVGPNEPYTNMRRIYLRDRVQNTTTRVDFAWNWEPHHKQYLTSDSFRPRISADGRQVVYDSWAYFIVQSDTNAFEDVFIYDVQKNVHGRVSDPHTAGNTDGSSTHASLSADGRIVAFRSYANNILPIDTNNNPDFYVRDVPGQKTSLASIGPDGKQVRECSSVQSISGDGRYIAFVASLKYIKSPTELFIYDRQNNFTKKVSPDIGRMVRGAADFTYHLPSISGDGRYVVCLRQPFKDNTFSYEVVLFDVTNNTSKIIAGGRADDIKTFLASGPSISRDGRWIAFVSDRADLVAGDTNGQPDIFVYLNQSR